MNRVAALLSVCGMTLAANAGDGLRVVAYNITNYGGGLASDVQNVFYGTVNTASSEFVGQTLDADVVLLQEFQSTLALQNFVCHLNSAAGSPGDWRAAPFIKGGGFDSPVVFRESKLDLLQAQFISGSHPRTVVRYIFQLDGYDSIDATFALYSSHLKAGAASSVGGSGLTNGERRLGEAIDIRADIETVISSGLAGHAIHGGDFNISSSSEAAYQVLVDGSMTNDPDDPPGGVDPRPRSASGAGVTTYETFEAFAQELENLSQTDRCRTPPCEDEPTNCILPLATPASQPVLTPAGYTPPAVPGAQWDPIARPGSWRSSQFTVLHTQDPALGAAGMDDRYDQILLTERFGDGDGFEYDGMFAVPQDLSRIDDPNHSYRVWGNDGTSYNSSINQSNNQQTGNSIAASIERLASNAGHVPVFLDLIVPARAEVGATTIDLGDVTEGESVPFDLDVIHAGDAVWGSGIQPLRFSFEEAPGSQNALSVPPGLFEITAGAVETQAFTFTSSDLGPQTAEILVSTNDPELLGEPIRVTVTADVVSAANPVDFDGNGVANISDLFAFITAFTETPPQPATDFDGNGVINISDLFAFITAFTAQP
ncbi:MAG: GC-type dockerin domain-anchored protein [Planctomycetota bacterium]